MRQGLGTLQERDLRQRRRGEMKDMLRQTRLKVLKKDGHLHIDVLGSQSEVFQVVVSRCVSIGIQAGGEVTAGHGDTHYAVADT